MKQWRSLLLPVLFLLSATIMLSLGIWLVLVLLDSAFYYGYDTYWGFLSLLPITLVLVLLLVIYTGYSSGLFREVAGYVKNRWFRPHQPPSTSQDFTPITVAQLSFKLDDPGEEEEFNKFLDSPIFSKGQHLVTPAELMEQVTFYYAREIERTYGSKVVVETRLARGSLEGFFQITAVDIIVLLAAYHDLVESARLFREQISDATTKVRTEYRRQSGRTMRVVDGIDIAPKPQPVNRDDGQLLSGKEPIAATPPVSVTNSYVPPQNNRDLNISISTADAKTRSSGCVSSCLLALILVTLVAASFLYLFVDYESRLVLFDRAAYFVGNLMRLAADALSYWANILAPAQPLPS